MNVPQPMDAAVDAVAIRKETEGKGNCLGVEVPVLAALESASPGSEEKMAVGRLKA